MPSVRGCRQSGPTLDEQITLFAQNSATLKSGFHIATSPADAAQQLAVLARENNWKRIATHRHSLVQGLAEKLGLPCMLTDAGYSPTELEKCDAGITGCDALVAQTGSVLVTGPSAGGRTLSVLPPHHVVIAQRSQMVPDLASALQVVRKRYAPNWPSFLSFITGPSRTGDIERILVLAPTARRNSPFFCCLKAAGTSTPFGAPAKASFPWLGRWWGVSLPSHVAWDD